MRALPLSRVIPFTTDVTGPNLEVLKLPRVDVVRLITKFVHCVSKKRGYNFFAITSSTVNRF